MFSLKKRRQKISHRKRIQVDWIGILATSFMSFMILSAYILFMYGGVESVVSKSLAAILPWNVTQYNIEIPFEKDLNFSYNITKAKVNKEGAQLASKDTLAEIMLISPLDLPKDNKILAFEEISQKKKKDSIQYQISLDGKHWNYFNGEKWAPILAKCHNCSNNATEINKHIEKLENTSDTLQLKVILDSSHGDMPVLEKVKLEIEGELKEPTLEQRLKLASIRSTFAYPYEDGDGDGDQEILCDTTSDYTYYTALSEDSSGTYPTAGTESDSVTITDDDPSSEGYLYINLDFDNIPSGIKNPIFSIEFVDLDLHGDSIRSGENRGTLTETFTLLDENNNVLATLDDSHPDDDNFIWETSISENLIQGNSLSLIAKFTANVTLTRGDELRVTNSSEGIKNISLCGEKDIWDKSSIEVSGVCEEDVDVVFTISNTSEEIIGDMQGPSEYRVYRNDTLIDTQSFQLNGGESITVTVNGNNDSIRLEVDQRPGHPGETTISDTVDECGTVHEDVPPVALDDTAETEINTPVMIDILDNDSDSDGTLVPGSVTIESNPSDGIITNIDTDTGEVTYTPDQDFSGEDSFEYQVCDNDALCDTATVTITVLEEVEPVCGNGIEEGDEECDDGNTDDGDGCSSICVIEDPECGNDLLEDEEECDDGNLENGDGCNDVCEVEGYLCDNTNFSFPGLAHGTILSNQYADIGMTITAVANGGKPNTLVIFDSNQTGTADPDLEVDIGNLSIIPENTIDSNGDGYVDSPNDSSAGGKQIYNFNTPVTVVSFKFIDKDTDDPATAKAFDENNDLITEVSIPNGGDASIQTIEVNASDTKRLEIEYLGSGAVGAFSISCDDTVCGDGIKEGDEECDDGNNDNFDGCSSTCEIETPECGNGHLETGEECDDGNTDDFDGCSSICEIETPECGNGHLETGEACDDGNTDDGDGCSSTCEIEEDACGNGTIEGDEECEATADPNGCNPEYICNASCECIEPPPTPNPPLTEACGLDIVLVLDSSDSLNNSEIQQVKDAANAFVDTLSGTPTHFGVVDFDTQIINSFALTDNMTNVHAAINSIGHTGVTELTNWEAGLIQGQSLFAGGSPDKPNLMVIITDGDPTTWGYPSSQGSYGGTEPDPPDINRAIMAANIAKASGTRMLAIGVTSSPTVSNLIKISGPNLNTGNLSTDVITTGFSELFNTLAGLATEMCGGTITINKYINFIGPDSRGGLGWGFDIDGNSLTTDANGQTEPLELDAGSGYAVIETVVPDAFYYLSASCKDQDDSPVGTPTVNGVENISIGNDDIISCDFLNQSICGDGNLDPGEECDDGNNINGDGCSAQCTLPTSCNEVCTQNNGCGGDDLMCSDGFCRNLFCETESDCICPACGDGQQDPEEECDDGNNVDGDGCSAICTLPENCNDFCLISLGCDDGLICNNAGTDAEGSCRNPVCTEENDCLCPTCGDGNLDPGEECDDGNTVDGDGCSSLCTLPENCNDTCVANLGCDNNYVCSNGSCRNDTCTEESDCVCPACGDGNVDPGEDCDDGNNQNGDGCSSECNYEETIIYGYKIVCEDDSDLPNWGDGGPDITSTTAIDYITNSQGRCHLEGNWDFQWGKDGEAEKQSGDHIGPAPPGTGWNDFDSSTTPSQAAQVILDHNDLDGISKIWVRENLKSEYIPFTSPPKGLQEDNVSAEIYCHTDVLNYDNYDYIINPEFGESYYCVGFNTLIKEPPVAIDDATSTDENTPVTIDILNNDYDPDGVIVPSSVEILFDPGDGILNTPDPITGEVTYTPNPGFAGIDTFVYKVYDNDGLSDTATVTINVLPNDPPVANNDFETTLMNIPVTVDVLINDSDPDGFLVPSSIVIDTPPGNGTITNIDPITGEITYSPSPGYYGIDTFVYRVFDNDNHFDTATVTITVLAPPVATNDSSTTDEDTAVDIDILDNDYDPDGTINIPLTEIVTPPNNGTIISINPTTGVVNYMPNSGYVGSDTFEYRIFDNDGLEDTANVNISINDLAPPVANDDFETTIMNIPVDIDILLNDYDPDGSIDPSSLGITSPPTNGTIANIDPITGVVSYNPNPGFYGFDTFIYKVCDDSGVGDGSEYNDDCDDDGIIDDACGIGYCDSATVTIKVLAPPIAEDDSESTEENEPVTIDILDNDIDPDGTIVPSSVEIVTPPSDGNLGTPDPITGEIEYTPDWNFNGIDTFEYRVYDNDGLSDTATVTIAVAANAPPVANDDFETTPMNTPKTVDVLFNDSDPDGFLVPSSVTVTIPPTNGNIISINPTTGEITYSPNLGFYGVDTFEYKVYDNDGAFDTAVVTITVLSPPVANNDSESTEENESVDIDILDNDFDPDGIIIPSSIVIISPPSDGTLSPADPVTGVITYTPNTGYNGIDTFEYKVYDNDGLFDTAIVTIAINANAPPVANDDNDSTPMNTPVTTDILNNDYDTDGTLVESSVEITAPPSNGFVLSVNPTTGDTTYIPNFNFYGTDTFEYKVYDNDGAFDTAIVTITVLAPPVAEDDSESTEENDPVTIDILDNDYDLDGIIIPSSVEKAIIVINFIFE